MEDLRYPIGKEVIPEGSTAEERARWIQEIAEAPGNLRSAVHGLTAEQLNTPYRPGGWTVRQVVHHVPDSHLHSYIRFKFAMAEENPRIRPYDESQWAQFADVDQAPIEASLQLLEGLHHRWVRFLRSLTEADWQRQFQHPERGPVRLYQNLALYAWHGRHHVAHILGLRNRMGW
jgi:uncharacterized damage-inducible protein DinB